MKLKGKIDVNSLLETARTCKGDVFLHTAKGDILNLRSLLSRYTMISIMGNYQFLEGAQVVCVQEEDYQRLAEFLEE